MHGRHLFLLFSCLLAFAVPGTASARATVLAQLEHGVGDRVLRAPIEATAGNALAPHRGSPQLRWRLLPGEALSGVRPADRVIEFYSGATGSATLLCRVVVRYFQRPDGRWQPHFRLDEEPLVARDKDGWKPLALAAGAPTVVLYGPTVPNAEGYLSELQFGLNAGPVTVDLWTVR